MNIEDQEKILQKNISDNLTNQVSYCKNFLEREYATEDLKEIKNIYLDICNIIEKYKNEKYENLRILMALEVILYHFVTNNKFGAELILTCLKCSDEVFELYEQISFFKNNASKNNIPENKSNEGELNLFNPDGSRCTIEELEKEC